jgi:hypothetical protein
MEMAEGGRPMAKRAALKLEDLKARKTEAGTPGEVEAAPDAAGGDQQRKGQTLRLSVAAWRQLKYLSIDRSKTAHDLLVEAVNDLFVKYGKPPIA